MPAPVGNRELDSANWEDLGRLAQLWQRDDLSNADIRNSSHIVRRLLIHGDIIKSAAPRSMRLVFVAPDNQPMIRATRNRHVDFWQSGGTTVFGVWIRASMLHRTPQSVTDPYFHGWNPDQTIELRLDSFLRQAVFGYMGETATRHDVITYVANKAGGPHFDEKREKAHSILDRIRSAVNISLENGVPSFGIDPDRFTPVGADFLPKPNSIDPVFLELAATCRYISASPSIGELTEVLRVDLGR